MNQNKAPSIQHIMATIVVVEDEVLLSRALESELEQEHYLVLTAFDALEGIRLMRENTVHLLILDMILPQIDGFSMLKDVRKMPSYKKLPVLVLTNLDVPELRGECEHYQPLKYLVKADTPLDSISEHVQTMMG